MNCWARALGLVCAGVMAWGQEQSALEREPQGWQDIMPGPKLQGWTRLPIAPDPLAAVSQWKLMPGGILLCEGDRGHDWAAL